MGLASDSGAGQAPLIGASGVRLVVRSDCRARQVLKTGAVDECDLLCACDDLSLDAE